MQWRGDYDSSYFHGRVFGWSLWSAVNFSDLRERGMVILELLGDFLLWFVLLCMLWMIIDIRNDFYEFKKTFFTPYEERDEARR